MADGYSDLDWVKEYVLEQLPELGDVEPKSLTVDLEALKGALPNNGGKFYRPDFYIARWLDTHKGLIKAKGGTEFRTDQRVAAYLKRQADLDSAHNLTVLPGTEAVKVESRRLSFTGSVPTRVVR